MQQPFQPSRNFTLQSWKKRKCGVTKNKCTDREGDSGSQPTKNKEEEEEKEMVTMVANTDRQTYKSVSVQF